MYIVLITPHYIMYMYKYILLLPSVDCSVADDVAGAGVPEDTSCDVPVADDNKPYKIWMKNSTHNRLT